MEWVLDNDVIPAGTTHGDGAVLVLGMHRSGTSCLAGSLQQRGLHLGEVYQSRPHNRKGNRENQRVMDLNNAVLAQSNASWDRPPQHLSWDRACVDQRDAIVRELQQGGAETCGAGAWGFKDPRTLLTLAFWREGLREPRMVGTFRHPAQVARSLHARDPLMSMAQGFELWRAYNQRLLDEHARSAFPMVSFDAPESYYRQAVAVIARELELNDGPANDFFEQALRTSATVVDIEVPAPIMAIHARLLEAAGGPCP